MKIVKDQFTLLTRFLRGKLKIILIICAAGFLLSAVIGVVVGLLFPQVVIDTVNSFSQTIAESGIENPDGTYSALCFIAHNWYLTRFISSISQPAPPNLSTMKST